MRRVLLLAMLAFAFSGWAQSLGDVARADRESKKTAAKVITNEDLKTTADQTPSEMPDDLTQQLKHMRQVMQQICANPGTDHGRKLSDFDKQQIADGVKPLRARVNEFERIQKQYKEQLAALDREWEAKFQKLWPSGHLSTEDDVQRANALRQEYESQRASLMQKAESDLKPYSDLQQELESIGKECPEAAKTVPD